MPIKFLALETPIVRMLQTGGCDANNRMPEKVISPGGGMPCRHCLSCIEAGEEMLILAYRPFETIQPYAEQGPVFLHARQCERYTQTALPPEMFLEWEQLLVRGYTNDERIRYGTGKVVKTRSLVDECRIILSDAEIEYVHIRSASNNCFQCRVERM